MIANPSRSGAFGRGVLYVIIAVCAVALADDYLQASAPAWVLSGLKMLAAAAGAWRLYIDQSISQSRAAIMAKTESEASDGSNENEP